ncbi:MAG TPA: S8 family serine peptidase [Steroidobacteraceae bacterium]
MGENEIVRRALTAVVVGLLASTSAAATPVSDPAVQSLAHRDATGRLQIDVHFDCALAPPLAALTAAGVAVASSVKLGTLCVVEGWAPATALAQIQAVAGVTRISAPTYVRPTPPHALRPVLHGFTRPPEQKQGTGAAIDQNGVSIMRADQFVAQTGTTGTGVMVGVQSIGVATLSVIQARGELPASIQVLYPTGNTTPAVADEGTALLEEIHAVAPGATLVFCGPNTFVDFTSCMTQLINAGATVLVDDTGFAADDLMSLNNDQSTAIAQILSQNPAVMAFSSAGNSNGTYWEGNYSPVSVATTSLPALSCPSGAGTADTYVAAFGSDTSQTLQVMGDSSFPLLLAWADPPTQLTSHFDVFWFAAGSSTALGCMSTASAATNELMQYVTLPAGSYTLLVASPDASTSGKFLKLWAGGDGLTALSVSTPGALVSPQAAVPGLLTVGAVVGSDGVGNTIETFSSTGPLTLAFPTPAQLQAPALVAPDAISIDAQGTYFTADLFPDGNFYGTSAAVANAAGVAALLRGAFPALSAAQASIAVQSGATALGATVPNDRFGYGRIDALGALATLPTPTITALSDQTSSGSASTAAQPLGITGTGVLHFSVSSSNPTLVPNSIVSAGQPGVTLSTGCGSSTLACTVSVKPVIGQAGTAILTISLLDGANRPATTQWTLTATDPAPVVVTPPTPVATGGGGGGGGMQLGALLWLSALMLWAQRRAATARATSIRSTP